MCTTKPSHLLRPRQPPHNTKHNKAVKQRSMTEYGHGVTGCGQATHRQLQRSRHGSNKTPRLCVCASQEQQNLGVTHGVWRQNEIDRQMSKRSILF